MNKTSVIDSFREMESVLSGGAVAVRADKLPSLLREPVIEAQFFSRLDDPEPLEALRASGWFRRGRRKLKNGLVPQLTYLSRVASFTPIEVSRTLRGMRMTSAHEKRACLTVLSALPAEQGVAFDERVLKWISEGPDLALWERELAGYVKALAHAGFVNEATGLVRRAIGLRPSAEPGGVMRSRLAGPWYESFLESVVPSFVGIDGMRILDLLCATLKTALRAEAGDRLADRERGDDLSWLWRPAIEDHTQNEPGDQKGVLVSHIRDVCLELGALGSTKKEILRSLEARQFLVFRRVGLHALRAWRGPVEVVRARLTDRGLFDDSRVLHEYYHLLHDCFELLSTDDQALILGWIDEGPDKDAHVTWVKEREGSPPSEGQVSDYCDFWRIKKLMPISEALSEEWKQRFDGLVARLGLPEHPDFPVYHGTWVGPTSPLRLDDIRAMEPGKLIEHLRDWVPPQEWDAPTPEGLGRLVTAAVADDPARYVPVLGSLTGIEATYVCGFLEGFRQAVEAEKSFEWGPILDLATQVVYSPWPTPQLSSPVHDRDSDWGSTRKTIAAVIEAGLGPGASEIPVSFRETVWKTLESLADDPDPTPEDENRYGEGGFDAVTMSINTVRGRAMHAIVQYGLWVARHARKTAGQESDLKRERVMVTEIWPVLDRHLGVTQDPSLAVRSVYGQWFPWIHLLSPDWAASRVDAIFPRDSEQEPWWAAAWVAYVMYSRPFDDVLAVLRLVYEHAVEQMSPDEKPLLFGDRPSERLGEHLVTYAWRGVIALEPVDPLLEKYWTKADVSLRRHALGHVGRSLREWLPAGLDPGIPPVIERLKLFWASAVSRAGQSGQDDEGNELSAFTWWFASGQFDDAWALDQLDLVLQKTSLLDGAHLVAERLVETVEREPLRSVRALDKLVRSDREGWRIVGWKDDARKVLEKAMESEGTQTRRACVALVNRLVAKGHLEFRKLVDANRTADGGEQTQ